MCSLKILDQFCGSSIPVVSVSPTHYLNNRILSRKIPTALFCSNVMGVLVLALCIV